MIDSKLIKNNPISEGLMPGLLFGLIIAIILAFFATPIYDALILGIKMGAMFGFAMAVYSYFNFLRHCDIPEEILKEGLIAYGPASSVRGANAIGGWLYLTREHVIFKPNKVNFSPKMLLIPRKEIQSFEDYNSLGILRNGLSIIQKEATKEKFIVAQRGRWLEAINSGL